MADSTTAARRYAGALFAVARKEGQVDAVEGDLVAIGALVAQAPQLLETMRNPLVPAPVKGRILDQALGTGIHPISLRFLHLLVKKRRSDVLPHVYELYREMANDYRGVVPAYVASAVPLTPAEEQALVAKLSRMTGKQIALQKELDPELVGGVRVRVGDTVIDGTVVGYLRRLRQQLKEALV